MKCPVEEKLKERDKEMVVLLMTLAWLSSKLAGKLDRSGKKAHGGKKHHVKNV